MKTKFGVLDGFLNLQDVNYNKIMSITYNLSY